jgi:hypothetical protein
MLGLRRETKEEPRNSSEQRSQLELDMRIRALERIVKQLDYDLQDAVDGFYRRRQADRMREIRKEEGVEKKPRARDVDILERALRLSEGKNKTDNEE